MKDIPKGAITSEKELLFAFLGKTLYCVHGLGTDSFVTTMVEIRNLHSNSSGQRIFEYTDLHYGYDTECFLGDCNIGAHHNHHYLFSNEDDANAYLFYARKHTPGMRKHAFFS